MVPIIFVYPFLIFPTPCAFEWVSPNSPLPSPDNLCKRHYGKCKHVYSMQIKPFLNHFLRANAKNIIGSKLKLKFWTKKKLFWISWTRKVYKAVWVPISNRASHIHHNTHKETSDLHMSCTLTKWRQTEVRNSAACIFTNWNNEQILYENC